MIKQIRASYFANFKNAQYCALSTDTIPDYLENGDEVYIIDTGKNYIYDASSSSLIEKKPITGLPSGGVSGQVLGKTGTEDDDVQWITLTQGIQTIGFATDTNGILNVTVTNS